MIPSKIKIKIFAMRRINAALGSKGLIGENYPVYNNCIYPEWRSDKKYV